MGILGVIGRLIGHVVNPIRNLLYWAAKAIPGVKKLFSMSFAAKAAFFLFFVLLAVWIVVFFVQGKTVEHATGILRSHLYWAIPFVFVLPIVCYIAIRMWQNAKFVSRFPDIDRAWEQGIEAIAAAGIDVKWAPIFLVVGVRDERAARQLMGATDMEFNVAGVPEGPAALHWYASEEAIFIVPTGVGCLSKLAKSVDQLSAQGAARPETAPSGPSAGGETVIAGTGPPLTGPPSDESAQTPAIYATIVPGAAVGDSAARPGQPAAPQMIRLQESEAHVERARLDFLSEQIKCLRSPLVPVNGILTTTPFSAVHDAASAVQVAAADDLATIRAQFRLRCPLILLITEMQQEEGFLELTRRIGQQQARESRFGQKFDHRNPPESEQLDALAWHACGFFKDWIYQLFRSPDALKKYRGNTSLFGLLCKIRGEFTTGLAQILANSFGFDAGQNKATEEDQFYFAGCYFASTGQSDDEQAFVKSVFRRLCELEGELSWTSEAVMEDERFHAYANIAALIAIVSFLALVGSVLYVKNWLPFDIGS